MDAIVEFVIALKMSYNLREPSATTEYPCIDCDRNVRPRQQAVDCDRCGRWQHRICKTSIPQRIYNDAKKSLCTIFFKCKNCNESGVCSAIYIYDEPTGQSATDFVQDERETRLDIAMDTNQTSVVEDETPANNEAPVIEEAEVDSQDGTPDVPMDAPASTINDSLSGSFNISQRQFNDHVEIEEAPVCDDNLPDSDIPDVPTTYTVLPTGSKRGKPLLVTNDGYSYGIKTQKDGRTRWRCTSRPKNGQCMACVVQIDDDFSRNDTIHNHPADPSLQVKKTIYSKVKDVASHSMFRPASDIVEEVVRDTVTPTTSQFKPKNMNVKRITNLHRAKTRPPTPEDIHFQIDRDFLHVDEFLVADLHMETYRHMIFSSPFQLDLLRQAKRWFIDGTFKIVGKPFGSNAQLWTINSFVSDGEKKKQFPMVFVIMTRRRRTDYVEVLEAILEHIDQPMVETFVADFEIAAWQAIRQVFPEMEIKGCVFHWTKAVFAKVACVGLRTAYNTNPAVRKYIKQFLALPFLPADHIKDTFDYLAPKANTDSLKEFVAYVQDQWIDSEHFNISTWCIFGQTIRTNNHIEAWHRRMNVKGTRLSFYKLAVVLQQEAEHVQLSVEARDLETEIRKKYTKIDKEVDELWTKYRNTELTTSEFLHQVNKVYRLGQTKNK